MSPGEVEVEGRRCVELKETPQAEYPGHWRTYWLDVDRDYVIVKHESRCRHFREKGWGGAGTRVMVSYRNDAVHGWVPSGWKSMWLNQETGAIYNVQEAEVTKCEFNAKIPSALFELPFPPGTYVKDRENHQVWIALPEGRKRIVTPAELKAQVPYEKLLKSK